MTENVAVDNWYGGGKWYDYTLGKKNKCVTTAGVERDPAGTLVAASSKYVAGVAVSTCTTAFDKEF